MTRVASPAAKLRRQLHPVRVLLPVLCGLGAVAWLLHRSFDWQEFRAMSWTGRAWTGIALAGGLLVLQHLAYSGRLYLLGKGSYSFRKSTLWIFLWEFSAAVSPTSVGGSAIASFILIREGVPIARSVTIIIYTVVLDSLFFLLSLPLWLLIFGTDIIRPGMDGVDDLDGWGFYFVIAYLIMLLYNLLFSYGLFVRPRLVQQLLLLLVMPAFMQRFRPRIFRLGRDLRTASAALKKESPAFHLTVFGLTALAWSCRFLLLSALLTGLLPQLATDWPTQGQLFARLQAMYVIVALSPTPGGAGLVELLFGGFLSDYISRETTSTVLAFLWRLLTFYSYLLAGAMLLPVWWQATERGDTDGDR